MATLLLTASLAVANGPMVATDSAVKVSIENFEYQPADLKVMAGTTVKWVHTEKRASHPVLLTGPEGFEWPHFYPDESCSRRFDKAVIYPCSCGSHTEMRGESKSWNELTVRQLVQS